MAIARLELTEGLYDGPVEERRHTTEHVLLDHRRIVSHTFISALLDSFPLGCVVLNEYRQVLLANAAFLSMVDAGDSAALYGSRPGEILGCIHAHAGTNGCGTSRQCRVCGALQTVLECQRYDTEAVHEARLRAGAAGEETAVNIRVTAKPFPFEKRGFVIAFLEDIRGEEERHLMERMFFHDLLNTTGAILGVSDMLEQEGTPPPELARMVGVGARQLHDEIQFHRMLSAAEKGSLEPQREPVDVDKVIEDAATVVKGLSASMAKEATIRVETQELRLHTDSTILKRVVINMLKNALEASNGEETICAGCHHRGDRAVVWVRNRGVIPEAVQFQLFQRFFSTKGKGRGIGTYSMKLLTERYLGGEVAFSSDTQKGTEFRALLPL